MGTITNGAHHSHPISFNTPRTPSLQSIRFLFTICFLLFATQTSAVESFNRSHYSIPPPLPEDRWEGKSKMNYTLLYMEFSDALICLTFPVGVFGFYYWFIFILLDLNTALGILRQRDHKWLSRIAEVIGFVVSIVSIYQAIQQNLSCADVRKYEVFKHTANTVIAGAAFSAIASVLAIFDQPLHALWCLGVAITIRYFSGMLFFYQLTRSAGINPDLWDTDMKGEVFDIDLDIIDIDVDINLTQLKASNWPNFGDWKVETGAHIAAFVPWLLLVLGTIGLIIFLSRFQEWTGYQDYDRVQQKRGMARCCSSIGERLGRAALRVLLVVSILLQIGVFLNGLANVFMGKVVGDPGGGYIIRNKWGKYSAGVAGLSIFGVVIDLLVACF